MAVIGRFAVVVVGAVLGSAGVEAAANDPLSVTFRGEPSADPDYGVLVRYAWAGGMAVVLALVAYLMWSSRKALTAELPGIDDNWSFTDSWASSVGVAAALFTGVFGATDVLEKILGDDSANQVAVSVVSAAVAAGLIGVGPLLLTICRTGRYNRHTVGGVLLASTVVLGANLGLVWVMWDVLSESAIGSVALNAGAIAATSLLIAYAVRSIPKTLAAGAEETPVTKSDAIVAAEMISEAVLTAAQASAGVLTLDDTTVDAWREREWAPTAAEGARPRTSAMP